MQAIELASDDMTYLSVSTKTGASLEATSRIYFGILRRCMVGITDGGRL
jgi:hypothetical protein